MTDPIVKHTVSISCETAQYMPPNTGYRGHCSCGWWSDCYSQLGDTQRAVEVHLRQANRVDFDTLIARTSIGAAIADVKERGIDAHLADLERETRRPRKSKAAIAKKPPTKKRQRGLMMKERKKAGVP